MRIANSQRRFSVTKRSGLGKGLSSLIPADVTTEGAVYREIDVNDVVPNRYQPREHFDEETLAALTASVAEVGVIQPIVVRENDDGGFELIAGERRWRAAKRANLPAIPALVRGADDLSSLETAVVENLHRQDLNALEEAAAYQQLIEDFSLTQDEVATRVGRSRSAVANTIRLLQLPPTVQRLVIESQISAGHARALLSTPDRAEQERIAKQIVTEGLTVRQVEDLLKGDDVEPEVADEPPVAAVGDDAPVAGEPPMLAEPAVLELEELLAARLSTRVSVKLGKGPGKLVVDFADLDDLERIYRVITPPGTVV
ncbi:MAG: ParB/RepB/Spo0J family partition protein [Acidimicrobiales bacterium]